MPKSSVCEDQEFDKPHEQKHVERLQRVVSDHWKNILIGGLSEIIIVSFAVLLTYFLARQPTCETEIALSSTLPTSTLPITTIGPKSSQIPISSTLSTAAPDKNYCTGNFTYVNHKCWKLVTGPQSRAEADQACFILGGSTLFSIRNEQDNLAVLEFVKEKSVENLWTGLVCVGHDPFSCTWDVKSGTTAAYSNFAKDNPNGDCIYYMTTGTQAGQWASGSCDEAMSFVCELPATIYDETCVFNYDNYCYIPYDQINTSKQGQSICELSGSNLASIRSGNENRFLMSTVSVFSIFAIGGFAFSDDLILWYDGTPMGRLHRNHALSVHWTVFQTPLPPLKRLMKTQVPLVD
ncbi:C-type lectin domain-containing protein [Caenorhabditis elegans]|uniref:C-type lectin domain-containing protein n=1 Tax=Caenorhabditis elegans TaxID=6239 RepID=Q4ZGE3_CAEEL|nr:C-type lectin domain-containing protein [Caenorhabditis elegans]CAI94504.1 C-type lectin domain-containing protein [Caenorhabditis elegans]|eukprot:NP_001024149.1 C-type LECtin [Caenorhabditis elegans]